MALSPASGLANYSSGISSSVLTVDSNSDRVGIGTTNPQDTLQVGTAITMGSGTVTATQGNFQNVSIAGTLTYEDTTSVDSVGIITARSGISITGGGLSVVGDTDLVGNLTGVNATGISTIVNLTSTNVSVTGVTTLGNTVVGGGTTQLVVNGNARITGILTMGTSSITFDGTQNKIISGKYDFLGISTSHDDTAVDVFVYDTSKDSDGGEWRKRTSHTSWYNETLNTATRGSRREFPAVAVLVLEGTKLTIYDGDDPDLPMWMVFNTNSGNLIGGSTSLNAVTALNGIIVTAASGYTMETKFISDTPLDWFTNQLYQYKGNIEQRNDALGFTLIESYGIVNSTCNDVAMTVLPNAPIDSATGLPIPTIAVATDGGVSVIKDDGTVVDIEYGTTREPISISFNKSNNLNFLYNTNYVQFVNIPIPSADYSSGSAATLVGLIGGSAYHITGLLSGNPQSAILGDEVTVTLPNATSGPSGLTFISNETPTGYLQGAVAYATTSYNTGWMHGDIKGAFLSSNVATAVTFTNLATNGDFDQSSDLTSWTAYNATLTHQTDAIRVADNGNFSKAYQSFTTVDGRRYIASVNCKTLSGSDAVFSIGSANPAADSWNNNGTVQEATTGLKSLVFTASGTTNYVELGSTGGGFAEYQDVRIDEVKEEDRSVNNNPLEVYGTITKSAVATGADLVGYSFATTSDYLEQPYNSDIGGVGTSDFSVMGWFKNSPDASTWFDIASDVDPRFFVGSMFGATDDVWIYLNTSGSGTFSWNPGIGPIHNVSNWQFIAVKRFGTTISVSKNGSEWINNTSAAAAGNISGGNSVVTIGQNYTHAATAHTGQLALWRFSQSAPSAEQIKKIYEDEKVLFQENAQATLYGSSDAVTALGYDEVTDQLHVGTSSGRSDFQGLRRINNTTTAVTTAISAHDSFILEQ